MVNLLGDFTILFSFPSLGLGDALKLEHHHPNRIAHFGLPVVKDLACDPVLHRLSASFLSTRLPVFLYSTITQIDPPPARNLFSRPPFDPLPRLVELVFLLFGGRWWFRVPRRQDCARWNFAFFCVAGVKDLQICRPPPTPSPQMQRGPGFLKPPSSLALWIVCSLTGGFVDDMRPSLSPYSFSPPFVAMEK